MYLKMKENIQENSVQGNTLAFSLWEGATVIMNIKLLQASFCACLYITASSLIKHEASLIITLRGDGERMLCWKYFMLN